MRKFTRYYRKLPLDKENL